MTNGLAYKGGEADAAVTARTYDMSDIGKQECMTQNRVIAVLEQWQEKTHVLKQAMMQELLTGKTRLL